MENKGINAGRTVMVDPHGFTTVFFGTDSWIGEGGSGVVDMSSRSIDFEPSQFGVGSSRRPDYFYIIPEVDPQAAVGDVGVIKVQLAGQAEDEVFTMTANQLLAWAGAPMPYRVKRIYKTGTTQTFSIVW